MKEKESLSALYSFLGFRARSRLKGIYQDQTARVVELERRQKKQPVRCAEKVIGASMTA